MRSRRGWSGASLVTLVVVAGLLVSACGDDGGSSKSSKGAQQAELTGVTWVLDATTLVPGAGDVVVTASFDADTVHGESGCNAYSGPYTADPVAGTMTVGPNIRSTLVGCTPIPTRVESVYTARLAKVRRYRATARSLTMLDGDGKTLLAFEATDGAEAIQRAWTVTGYYTGDAIQSVAIGSTLTATFDGTQVAGDSGCNTFTGGYTVDGEAISIGPLAGTLRACADPAVGTQEQQYLAALALAKTFAVTGDRLDLFRADGGFAVTFEATSAHTKSGK